MILQKLGPNGLESPQQLAGILISIILGKVIIIKETKFCEIHQSFVLFLGSTETKN